MRKEMKESYRLPNCKYTTSVKRYIREWNRISKRLRKEFGFATIGMNPGFLLKDAYDNNNGATINLPMWAIQRIFERMVKSKD